MRKGRSKWQTLKPISGNRSQSASSTLPPPLPQTGLFVLVAVDDGRRFHRVRPAEADGHHAAGGRVQGGAALEVREVFFLGRGQIRRVPLDQFLVGLAGLFDLGLALLAGRTADVAALHGRRIEGSGRRRRLEGRAPLAQHFVVQSTCFDVKRKIHLSFPPLRKSPSQPGERIVVTDRSHLLNGEDESLANRTTLQCEPLRFWPQGQSPPESAVAGRALTAPQFAGVPADKTLARLDASLDLFPLLRFRFDALHHTPFDYLKHGSTRTDCWGNRSGDDPLRPFDRVLLADASQKLLGFYRRFGRLQF